MGREINMTAVYIANAIGVILIAVIVASNKWRIKTHGKESFSIKFIMVLTFISCCIDPLAFALDGKPGAVVRMFLYAESSWLYLANIAVSLAWIHFIGIHLNGRIAEGHKLMLLSIAAVAALLIFVNFFYPLVFYIDERNFYHRLDMYNYYISAALLFMTDAGLMYYTARRRSGELKYFPLGLYIVPVISGLVIQTLFYGVSVIWPFMAVAVAGVLSGLQNELIYTDALTGLYSRAYLDFNQRSVIKGKTALSGIMIDVDDFKHINDVFGHSVGDEALKTIALLIKAAVGAMGIVLRYAGDEFIVLLNTHDEAVIEKCKRSIDAAIEDFNEKGSAPYSLSLSMGSSSFCPGRMSFDGFIDDIDSRMYEAKRAHYADCKNDRRAL